MWRRGFQDDLRFAAFFGLGLFALVVGRFWDALRFVVGWAVGFFGVDFLTALLAVAFLTAAFLTAVFLDAARLVGLEFLLG